MARSPRSAPALADHLLQKGTGRDLVIRAIIEEIQALGGDVEARLVQLVNRPELSEDRDRADSGSVPRPRWISDE